MAMMNELQIATTQAKILHILSNWGTYSAFVDSDRFFTGKLGMEELEARKLELAKFKAVAAKRPFEVVVMEVEYEVMVQLGRILKTGDIDPVLDGLKSVVLIDEEDEICSVCREKMESGEEVKAMECMHMFHPSCILQWLKHKNSCPLCRFQMQIHQFLMIHT